MKLRALLTIAISVALLVLASGIAEAKPIWLKPLW